MTLPAPRLVAVVGEACTGCSVCLDFCPVDCIEPSSPPPPPSALSPPEFRCSVPFPDPPPPIPLALPPVSIRLADCIGCRLCAKVCEHLDLHAIRMVPVAAG